MHNGRRELAGKEIGNNEGCCGSRGTRLCCMATGVLGGLLLLIGLVVLFAGRGLLMGVVLKTMSLKAGSDRIESWLRPPVQAHLTGYGFHVTNPDEVLQGQKPILVEKGPFVYKAVTVKDSIDEDTGESNLHHNDDGETLTYRARKYYYLDRDQSKLDPDTTFLTIPNVPFLTGLSKIRDMSTIAKLAGQQLITKNGLGTPFINVSFTGLLWGYEDELPCLSLTRPEGCVDPNAVDIFAEGSEEEEDSDWNDDDWKRKKRAAMRYKRDADPDMRTIHHGLVDKPKAEYVDCKCMWGLFRDRNMTLRKPLKIHHGVADLTKKGVVVEFDNSPVLNWWKPGSTCDQLGQQDSSTLPPQWKKTDVMDMFISLMCRSIKLMFEKDTVHAGIPTLRYIPPPNALGSHTDADPEKRNEANACYCLKEEGFSCMKSGVLNMAPCKTRPDLPKGAPIALSYPHFYQADQSYLDAVSGLKPEKEKHQFYVDVEPTFGFPLSIRPRFQLNAVIRRDPDIEVISNCAEELVLPFLWAQDGFSEPSPEMAGAMKFGLGVPAKLSLMGGGVLTFLGLVMVCSCLGWVFWARRRGIIVI